MLARLTKADFRKGQKVYFGRSNGEKTLGEIVKLNPTKAKVRTLEQRGNGRGSGIGTEWSVPYSMMQPAPEGSQAGSSPPVAPAQHVKLTFNPFSEDNLLLEALLGVYSGLSPENLSADGEASMSHIRQRSAELNRRKRGIEMALGYSPDEAEVYGWWGAKTAYNNERRKQAV